MGLRAWWTRRREQEPEPESIEAGQVWELIPDNRDPFPQKRVNVDVLDVRAGWVRYAIGPLLPDLRMKESNFRACYRPARIRTHEEAQRIVDACIADLAVRTPEQEP
jgi:hypothetical protein